MKGLILFGHGSRVPGFDDVMEFHKERIAKMRVFRDVRIAYASTEPGVKEVIENMDSDEIFIVPLFISHGAHMEELPEILDIKGEKGRFRDKTVFICEPIGKDELITYAILNSVMKMQEKQ